jgi:ketosteroid isomerase-like protein
MSRENVEVVKRVYELLNALGRRDDDTVATAPFDATQLFDPDIELVQMADLPGTAGTFRGFDGLNQALPEVAAVLTNVQFHPERHVPSGDTVVSVVRATGTGRTSGVPVEVRLGHEWVIREGRIVRWVVHPDPAEAFEAVGLSE